LAPALFTLGLSAGRLVAHGVELRLSAAATVRIAAVIAIPAFVAIALGVPTLPLLLAFFLAGAGVGPIEPAVFRAVATRSQGAERGRTLATVTAVAYLGYLFSPPVLGLVADTFGFGALWALAALFAAGVVGLTLRLGRD
jgi:MFS family permease